MKEFIKSFKILLYFSSISPVLVAFTIVRSNITTFILLMILVISVQFFMNVTMDIFDFRNNVPLKNEYTLFPLGPYSILIGKFKLNTLKVLSVISIIVALIDALFILFISNEIILLYIGILAIFLSLIYIFPPFKLAYRGIGEISTFFDFGPLPLAGSIIALHGELNYSTIAISIFLGGMASAIRYLHHLPEDRENSLRVRKFRTIYGLIVLTSTLIASVSGFYLLLILIPIEIAHLMKLPASSIGISKKTYQVVILEIIGTLLIIANILF